MAKHSKKHPGFKAVAKTIAAKEGVSQDAANAILASKTRAASPAAKKANPRLNRVSMPEDQTPPVPVASEAPGLGDAATMTGSTFRRRSYGGRTY